MESQTRNPQSVSGQSPLAAIRRFMRPRDADQERCELCGSPIAAEHAHLVEVQSRRLVCACDACSILFSDPRAARYRRVPRRLESLADFQMSDPQWESLHLPINLAFLFHSTQAQRVVALYPSPAGATESLLTLESWEELASANPVLKQLEPDVEALLINRLFDRREYFRVPIDECYKLVGMIRTTWRGLSGGTTVWKEIDTFFASLRQRTARGPNASGGAGHA